jgi:hypothetical protein
VYEDKEVLAAQPWFSRLPPVFDNAVARPSTAAGANYNKVSTEIFQTTNLILSDGMPVDQRNSKYGIEDKTRFEIESMRSWKKTILPSFTFGATPSWYRRPTN